MTNNGFRRVNLNGMTTVDEFVGKLMINEQGTYWVNGILVDAMQSGDWLLIDEINACLPEIAFCLHSLLDDDRMIVLSEYDGRIVKPHPNFRLFASMNPHEDRRYGGTKPLNEALLDRFPVTVKMNYLPSTRKSKSSCSRAGIATRSSSSAWCAWATTCARPWRTKRCSARSAPGASSTGAHGGAIRPHGSRHLDHLQQGQLFRRQSARGHRRQPLLAGR